MTDTRQVSTDEIRRRISLLKYGDESARGKLESTANMLEFLLDELDRLRQQPAIAFRWEDTEHDSLLYAGDMPVAYVEPDGSGRWFASTGYCMSSPPDYPSPRPDRDRAKEIAESVARSQLSAGDGWEAKRPMSEAPRDGTEIVVRLYPVKGDTGPARLIVHWTENGWDWGYGSNDCVDAFDGWWPLPSDALPPKEHG